MVSIHGRNEYGRSHCPSMVSSSLPGVPLLDKVDFHWRNYLEVELAPNVCGSFAAFRLLKYDLGFRISTTIPCELLSGIQTFSPDCSGFRFLARWRVSKFLFCRFLILSSFPLSSVLLGKCGISWLVMTGTVVRRCLPIDNCAGLYPFSRGVAR